MNQLKNNKSLFFLLAIGFLVVNLAFLPTSKTDPIATLGDLNLSNGNLSPDQFIAQQKVTISNDTKFTNCSIAQFAVVRVPYKQDPVEIINRADEYQERAQQLVNKATNGDIFYFDEIYARCPGDSALKKVNSMVFKIK